MCEYIKDDGEQCGMDDHDGDFCHHHEDTRFAELWRRLEGVRGQIVPQSSLSADSRSIVMDETCNDCEASLRRTERLSQHPNQPRRLVFEAVVECDCDEHVLGATSERINSLPEGWTV